MNDSRQVHKIKFQLILDLLTDSTEEDKASIVIEKSKEVIKLEERIREFRTMMAKELQAACLRLQPENMTVDEVLELLATVLH